MLDTIRNVWNALSNVLQSIGIIDIIDIVLLTYLIYAVLKLVRETRAGQLMKGLLFLIVAYLLSDLLELKAIRFITEQVLNVGILAIIILFQPEFRRVLEKFGQGASKVSRIALGNSEDVRAQWEYAIPIIGESIANLASTKTGALIVIERSTKLGEQIGTGTYLNAIPSVQLFGNIFFHNTPLHDGAVIMRDGIVLAAACFLPKPQKEELIDKHLGSRHRAAIGMSENSDAIILVVSEETGQISIADNGTLTRNFNRHTVEQYLRDALLPSEDDSWRKKTIRLPLPFLRKDTPHNSSKDKEDGV